MESYYLLHGKSAHPDQINNYIEGQGPIPYHDLLLDSSTHTYVQIYRLPHNPGRHTHSGKNAHAPNG